MSHRRHRLGGLNIHRARSGAKPASSENLKQRLVDANRAADLFAALKGLKYPAQMAAARAAGVERLVQQYRAGNISLEAARSQARGAA